MKINDFNFRITGAFLLLMFCSSFSLKAETTCIEDLKPEITIEAVYKDTAIVIITNWFNTMGCLYDNPYTACVRMHYDNALFFRMRCRVGVPDITPFPALRIQYSLFSQMIGGTHVQGITEEITNDMLKPVIMETGEAAYEATFFVHLELANDCTVNNFFEFIAEYLLVEGLEDYNGVDPATVVHNAYPIAANPNLFPPDMFYVPATGYAQMVQEQKAICCYDPNNKPECEKIYQVPGIGNTDPEDGEGGGEGLNNGGDSFGDTSDKNLFRQNNKTELSISPNPFNTFLNATYTMAEAGEMTLSCLDAQGRVMVQNQYQHATGGTFDLSFSTATWPPGIYYLRFQNGQDLQTRKIVRLAN